VTVTGRVSSHKNFCLKNPWNVATTAEESEWEIACSNLSATPPAYFGKKDMKTFGLSVDDAHDKDDWRGD